VARLVAPGGTPHGAPGGAWWRAWYTGEAPHRARRSGAWWRLVAPPVRRPTYATRRATRRPVRRPARLVAPHRGRLTGGASPVRRLTGRPAP